MPINLRVCSADSISSSRKRGHRTDHEKSPGAQCRARTDAGLHLQILCPKPVPPQKKDPTANVKSLCSRSISEFRSALSLPCKNKRGVDLICDELTRALSPVAPPADVMIEARLVRYLLLRHCNYKTVRIKVKRAPSVFSWF